MKLLRSASPAASSTSARPAATTSFLGDSTRPSPSPASPEVILDARALVLQAFRRNADRVRSKPETRNVLTAILRACRAAVRPFDATCRRDKALLAPPGPEASVATYRLGQWRILNDAVHVLEDALQRRKRKWRRLWERRRLQYAKQNTALH